MIAQRRKPSKTAESQLKARMSEAREILKRQAPYLRDPEWQFAHSFHTTAAAFLRALERVANPINLRTGEPLSARSIEYYLDSAVSALRAMYAYEIALQLYRQRHRRRPGQPHLILIRGGK